jgi:ATP-binding protein involved in chromosome partitioning
MMTEGDILQALSSVINPDSEKDIVSSGMVSDIKIQDKNIYLTIFTSMTTAPYKGVINEQSEQAIKQAANEDVQVFVTFSSKKAAALNTEPAEVLPEVKNIIAVASGKGGVGKSTVAANLALVLAQKGNKVGLMDADIYGPSVPMMFGLRGESPEMVEVNGKGKILPLEKYGIKVMSIGFLVDERQAVIWRGPIASTAIRQFVTDVHWGELDYLVIDMPPGTGDIHLTLLQIVPVTGAVIVTTPQEVALADAKKGIAMFGQSKINVPIIGLVENMAYFTPAELPDNKYYIFGKEGGERLASEYDLNFLGQIPLVQSVCESGDHGVPAMLSDDVITKKAFVDFAEATEKQIAAINTENTIHVKL